MNAADVLISLFGVLTFLSFIGIIIGTIYYIILPEILSWRDTRKYNRKQERRRGNQWDVNYYNLWWMVLLGLLIPYAVFLFITD
tara:strand:- start:22 stop:273 length:252 start_codon:yes stop_codon:yes gene_type:complete